MVKISALADSNCKTGSGLSVMVFPAAIVAMKFKNPCHGVLIRQVAGQTGY